MPLKLYNTLTRKKEIFKPLKKGNVGIYSCGPTVYWYQHIGNLRTYVSNDILKRIFLYNGFKVKHVINVTDVGHLTSDADTGEDKIEKSARKKKKSPYELAEFYTKIFKESLKSLNILEPDIWCKATDHIEDQIELVKKLEEKGVTYKIRDGIYFDTSKFPDYGKLARLDIKGLKAGARIKMVMRAIRGKIKVQGHFICLREISCFFPGLFLLIFFNDFFNLLFCLLQGTSYM